MTNEEYRKGIAKLARLVKPGGTLLMLADENVQSWAIAGKEYKALPITREFLRETLESAGFTITNVAEASIPTITRLSAMFVVAVKRAIQATVDE